MADTNHTLGRNEHGQVFADMFAPIQLGAVLPAVELTQAEEQAQQKVDSLRSAITAVWIALHSAGDPANAESVLMLANLSAFAQKHGKEEQP